MADYKVSVEPDDGGGCLTWIIFLFIIAGLIKSCTG